MEHPSEGDNPNQLPIIRKEGEYPYMEHSSEGYPTNQPPTTINGYSPSNMQHSSEGYPTNQPPTTINGDEYPYPEKPDKTPSALKVLSIPSVSITWIVVTALILFIDGSWGYTRMNSCSLTNKHIIVNGSAVFAPLVRDVANEYQQTCFGLGANVSADLQDNPNAIEQVEKGTIDIGTSDVFANPYHNPGLQDYQVAVVVFALVVNDSVDVGNLTSDQVRGIYRGELTNWQDIGGKQQPILLVSHPPTSDIPLVFQDYVLVHQAETISGPPPPMNREDSEDDAVAKFVKQQPGTVGYVSLHNAKKEHLKILPIDGYNPEESALVKQNKYKFWTIEHMYTKGVPDSPVYDFIGHMYSTAAKQIINQNGYLDPSEFSQVVLIEHVSQVYNR